MIPPATLSRLALLLLPAVGLAGAAAAQTLDLSITDPDEIAAICGGDINAGEPLFAAHCAACHTVGADEPDLAGPNLHALFGRTAGTRDGFDYSEALIAAGTAGMIWERETLHAYLSDPVAHVPGGAKDGPAIGDELARMHLLTWLRVNTTPPPPAPGEIELPAELLAMQGDVAYGEYLASECAGCHQLDGTASGGVPAIIGLDPEGFLLAMYEYRLGTRPNAAMQTVSRSLGDEELAALAAYFATLQPGAN